MRIATGLACALLAFGAANAAPKNVVRFEVPPAVEVKSGGSEKASLTFVVKDGYHVQANPASTDNLVPVVVQLTPGCGFKLGKPAYPKAQPYRLEGADSDLKTYSGKFAVTIKLTAKGKATAGECKLAGTLRYQACDAKTCLAPASIAFVLPVRVR